MAPGNSIPALHPPAPRIRALPWGVVLKFIWAKLLFSSAQIMRIFIVAQGEQQKDHTHTHTQAALKIVCYLLFVYLRPSFQYIKVQKPERVERRLLTE